MQRMMSGFARGGRGYRLLTLTTKAGVRDSLAEFQVDWRRFSARLRRRGIMPAYIRVMELTKSGLPHAHIVIAGGKWIDIQWIWATWQAVHGADRADIRVVRQHVRAKHGDGHRAVARYLAKYMSKDPVARLAYSPYWVWPGHVETWRRWLRAARIARVPWEQTKQVWQFSCEKGVPPGWNIHGRWALRFDPEAYGVAVGWW